MSEENSNDVTYSMDENNCVVGVSHSGWPLIIMRDSETRTKTALVCKESGNVLGEIDSDVFNDIITSWLLIDYPDFISVFDEVKV